MMLVSDHIQRHVCAEVGEQDAGAPESRRLREQGARHPIEAVGMGLRSMMAWVESDDTHDVEGSAVRG